jgi:hypothetical protein
MIADFKLQIADWSNDRALIDAIGGHKQSAI